MPNRNTPSHLLRMARLTYGHRDPDRGGGPCLLQSQAAKKAKKYVATREIVFDKASGKLRKPTVEETQALVDQISTLTNRSTEGLSVKQHQNGMKSMSLDGRFGGVILGRANEDGTTEIRCVMTLEEAVDFLGLEDTRLPNSKRHT